MAFPNITRRTNHYTQPHLYFIVTYRKIPEQQNFTPPTRTPSCIKDKGIWRGLIGNILKNVRWKFHEHPMKIKDLAAKTRINTKSLAAILCLIHKISWKLNKDPRSNLRIPWKFWGEQHHSFNSRIIWKYDNLRK